MGALAQAGGDLVDARAAQEAEGGIAEENHHRGPLPGVEGAPVLLERGILDAMQPILDRQCPHFRASTRGRPCVGRQAGAAIEHRLRRHPVLAPGALQAEDLL